MTDDISNHKWINIFMIKSEFIKYDDKMVPLKYVWKSLRDVTKNKDAEENSEYEKKEEIILLLEKLMHHRMPLSFFMFKRAMFTRMESRHNCSESWSLWWNLMRFNLIEIPQYWIYYCL